MSEPSYSNAWLADVRRITKDAVTGATPAGVVRFVMPMISTLSRRLRATKRRLDRALACHAEWRKRSARTDHTLRTTRRVLRSIKKRKASRSDTHIALAILAIGVALKGRRPRP